MREEFKEYIGCSVKIRVLSAVTLSQNSHKNDYINELKNAYSEIGKLGVKCRRIMDDVIYPLIAKDRKLSLEEIVELQDFCDKLLIPSTGDDLDLSLLFEISTKLVDELSKLDNINLYVNQLHTHISVSYANMNRTARLTVVRELTEFYKDSGLKAAEELKKYLAPDVFITLNNESKKRLLRGIRFYSALYDTFFTNEECNNKRYQALIDGIELYHNSFYRNNIDDYDWDTHLFRCLEHMGQLTERGNRWNFKPEQCVQIESHLSDLDKMWNSLATAKEILPEVHLRLILLRNSYFANKITKFEYKKKLLELYNTYTNDKYDMYSVQANMLIPAEYLAMIDPSNISAKEESVIGDFYQRIVRYVMGSVNMDAFNYLQEYLIAFLENFIEVPGGLTFEEISLRCMAAMHPPTFVHSLQVASISKTIGKYLINSNPELFVSNKYPTIEAVKENKAELLNYIYHCGMCHDFGKLALIDTIFMYGRKLFDLEFSIIKVHSLMSYFMLSKYPSTKDYADAAKNHHLWFNEKGGYPLTKSTGNIYSHIITIADCLDAATDSVGRSYNTGKTIEDVSKEFISDNGERYNPIITKLFENEEALEDFEYHINEGRIKNYGDTFQMLIGVNE